MTNEEQRALYDPQCTQVATGIKAIWLLYLRGHWDLLGTLGIDHETYYPLFVMFHYTMLSPSESNKIYRHDDALALVKLCPKVLDAAVTLTGRYRVLMASIEKELHNDTVQSLPGMP